MQAGDIQMHGFQRRAGSIIVQLSLYLKYYAHNTGRQASIGDGDRDQAGRRPSVMVIETRQAGVHRL